MNIQQQLPIIYKTRLEVMKPPFGDWFYMVFKNTAADLEIYLNPLNEDRYEFFPKGNYDTLTFQRDFIEEDTPEYVLDVLNLFNLNTNCTLEVAKDEKKAILDSLQLLKNELLNTTVNAILIKTILKVVLLQMVKQHKAGFTNTELTQKRVYVFLSLMELHYKTAHDTEFYAKRMGLSSKRLNQILKKQLQKTAKQLIQQRQLTEIKRLLQENHLSIKEIAYQLHFHSVSNFTRFFKRHTGQTPTLYKQTTR